MFFLRVSVSLWSSGSLEVGRYHSLDVPRRRWVTEVFEGVVDGRGVVETLLFCLSYGWGGVALTQIRVPKCPALDSI